MTTRTAFRVEEAGGDQEQQMHEQAQEHERERMQVQVKVAYSPKPGLVEEVTLTLDAGTTLHAALHASGLLRRHAEIDLERNAVGVWGELRALDAPLREGDRVEVYRPLRVDPMEARRLRQQKQRAAAAATCNPRR